MIGFIEGSIRFIRNETVLVDTQGVGYEIYVPQPFEHPKGTKVLYFTYDHYSENAHTLYGFTAEADYEVFLRLINVRGIGPKSALNILKKASGRRIIDAIEKGDVSALKALPGIGPKTASQMMLDLQGKLVQVLKDDNLQDMPGTPAWQETREALAALGYRPADIDPLNEQFAQSELNTQQLLRQALQELARRKGN